MRKLVVALACRNNGSRLYGKPLQNLDNENGITILDNIVACLSSFDCIDSVVLGISEGDENLDFVDYANKKGLGYIIGDEADVLSRLIQCGKFVGATDIFRTTSESPFPYFEMIDTDCIIFTKPNELFSTKKYFESKTIEVIDEEIIMDALTTIQISKDDEEKVSDLSSKIEELDDVQNVYMNVSLS